MTKRKRGRPRKNAETPIAERPRLTKYLVFGISIKPRQVEAHSLKVDRAGNLVFERDERVVGLFPGGTFAVEDEPESASHPRPADTENYASAVWNGKAFLDEADGKTKFTDVEISLVEAERPE
jgi:hypothetical protein